MALTSGGGSATTGPKAVYEYIKGEYEGANLIIDSSGELRASARHKPEMYFGVWISWPEVSRYLGRAKDVHQWLLEEYGISVSFKLVEEVCTEIGIFNRRA